MTHDKKLRYLLDFLLQERNEKIEIPKNITKQRQLLRSLMNIRPPKPLSAAVMQIQDEYLTEEIKAAGITELDDLTPVQEQLYLWKGDITTLRVDAIVNAANSGMLGCFVPCHGCIDNAIHTRAGIQLRLACADIMERQGGPEKTGTAKITPAFNLPSQFIIHTVGPIINGRLTKQDQELLSACYRSCLELAEQSGIKSIAFCCISTGEFHFPNETAAQIAVDTVKTFIDMTIKLFQLGQEVVTLSPR
jgi:O-acetyl-ADP-ribose deacetylase (regulator of RNase III)